MLRDLVKKCYQESIDEIFGEKYPDIKRVVENSGAKERFFDNMTRELRLVEKKRKVELTREKIKSLVKDYVKLIGQATIKKLELERDIAEKDSKSKVFLEPEKSVITDIRGEKRTKSGIILPSHYK